LTLDSKPSIFNGDLAHLPEALHWLTTQKKWVVWKWVKRVTASGKEKWTKPPYRPAFPKALAKSDDPSTWGSYEDAVAAVAAGNADGIGVMLLEGELAAADLDKCRDPVTGMLTVWAQRLCVEADQLGLYREVTVSGGGLRFIGLSHQAAELHRRFSFHRTSGEGLELYRNTPRFITISGLQEGQCEAMGEIDGYLDELLKRFDGQPAAPQSEPQPQGTTKIDFNTAGPQHSDYFRDIIENGVPEGERSERFSEVVWHLASTGMTIEEIVAELAKHPNGIGFKYAKRLFAEVTRCFNKWKKRRMASVGMIGAAGSGSGIGATNAGASAMNWPQIKVIPGELPRVINEAEDALLQSGIEFYQRGGMLMRPVRGTIVNRDGETEGWQLIQVTRPYLIDTLCCVAQFIRMDNRGKVPGWKPITAPREVAETLLSRRGKWKLPFLNGIVQAPFLRIDGSLCETPGYDLESKLLFRADDVFPPIPQQPSRDDALKALELLETLIGTFPFVSSADRSVALAAMLTSLDRRSISTAPLFAFNSPAAGTGKSKLVDLCAIIATGEKMAVISQGEKDEELVKSLSSALLAGMLAVSIDNCERAVKGDFLCQMLTQPKLNIRILGFSVIVETPANAIVFATGNNLTFSGDVIRRTLMCSMDAGVERPELRDFETDVVEETRDRRGELVAAGLTVLRAWRVADERLNLPAFGGFEDWSYRVREALVWLDRTDPCETLAEVRESDPDRGELITVIEQWKHHLTLDQAYTVQQVISRAIIDSDFHNALMAVAGNGSGSAVNNMRLGRWLKRLKGKVVNGLKLLQAGNTGGYPLWKLTRN
jgi:hypothetical protein